MKSSIGALASWTNLAASLAAFGLGLIILGKGGSAGADAITIGAATLLAAEALKVVIGICLAVQVTALAKVTGGVWTRLAGFAGALLMLGAGALGLGAILVPDLRGLAPFVNPVAVAGVAATGIWALCSVMAGQKDRVLPAWMTWVGALLALPSVAALFLPVAGLGAFVLGIFWTIGVATTLGGRTA